MDLVPVAVRPPDLSLSSVAQVPEKRHERDVGSVVVVLLRGLWKLVDGVEGVGDCEGLCWLCVPVIFGVRRRRGRGTERNEGEGTKGRKGREKNKRAKNFVCCGGPGKPRYFLGPIWSKCFFSR